MRSGSLFPQSLPHLDHPRFQVASQLLISRFRRLTLRRRKNRITKYYLQWREPLERFIPRPRLVKALDRHGHDWLWHVNVQDRRTLLKDFRRAVNRSLAFGIKNERATLPQTKCAGAHGRNQIGVGIHYHNAQRTRQPQQESFPEVLACSHREDFVKQFRWENAGQDGRIEIALVIGGNDESTIAWQLLNSAD